MECLASAGVTVAYSQTGSLKFIFRRTILCFLLNIESHGLIRVSPSV